MIVLYHTLLYMTATEDYQRQRLVAQAIFDKLTAAIAKTMIPYARVTYAIHPEPQRRRCLKSDGGGGARGRRTAPAGFFLTGHLGSRRPSRLSSAQSVRPSANVARRVDHCIQPLHDVTVPCCFLAR
eukprot:COSAG02_NODE_18878_length_912_cov_2.499385_1_plen_126_part_10